MTDRIESLLPHAGAMVLIDEVVEHDRQQIHCRARIDGLAGHPLASRGILPAAALVEYAAQAMAVHGALVGRPGDPPPAGRLAALSTLNLAGDRVEVPVLIDVHVTREGGDSSGALYAFRVLAGRLALASGRATVAFIKSGAAE
jgi:predicted hotdog family 3-hydroxylacyl-ACP dehydratase